MFGFLNVYKPIGKTSHDVVAILRRVLKIKQIGHTGTLDPFAEGVLPICIGKSTRLIEYLEDDKEYIATVNFGKSTNPYDIEGEIVSKSDKIVTKKEILQCLENFKGEILQTPPAFSAIKVKGKKLYEYARAGLDVEIKPRMVYISKIELLDFDEEKQIAQILVACSKGTYIRSIANDLGVITGAGAYLSKLVRTKAGKFTVDKSVPLDDLNSAGAVEKNLINPLDVIGLTVIKANDIEREKISHGLALNNRNFNNEKVVIFTYNDIIIAVGEVNKNKILIKKVFIS